MRVWLKIVPDYTVAFVRLMLGITIIDAMAGSLMVAAQATGRIRFLSIDGRWCITFHCTYFIYSIKVRSGTLECICGPFLYLHFCFYNTFAYNSFYDTFIALSLFSSSCVTLFVGIAISNPFTNRIVLCIT